MEDAHFPLSTSASELVDCMDKDHLSQIVTEPTRGDNILDLALTIVPRYISEVRVRPTILSDHSLVHALLGFDIIGKAPSSPSESRSPHSFRNADYHNDAMNESFNSVNWEDLWVLCDQDYKQYLELIKLTILQITLLCSPASKVPTHQFTVKEQQSCDSHEEKKKKTEYQDTCTSRQEPSVTYTPQTD